MQIDQALSFLDLSSLEKLVELLLSMFFAHDDHMSLFRIRIRILVLLMDLQYQLSSAIAPLLQPGIDGTSNVPKTLLSRWIQVRLINLLEWLSSLLVNGHSRIKDRNHVLSN